MLDISDSFSFEKSKLYAEKLETKYPFLSCTVIGRTYCGRGIFAFSVGNASNSVLITGGTGGKSSQTSSVLYRYIDNVCSSILKENELSGINFSSLTGKFGITVIPCLNPDSVQFATENKRPDIFTSDDVETWNANAAGVDIDLNFGSHWRMEKMDSLERNIIFACSEGFPGNVKESEPETRAFISFCKRHNFRSCLTLKNGNDNKIYYRRKKTSPASCTMMAKILASSCICGICEKEIPACPSRWFSDTFSKPAFLLEIEKNASCESLYEKLEEALILMSVM